MNDKHELYGPYERFFKRPIDVFCAMLAIIFFWWLYLIVAILVRIKLGSPILFKQERVGKNEKIFMLYKFRSMTEKKDEKGNLLSDSSRLTKFGKVLRATSLDELPEVINIFKGDMSVVGPRPLTLDYLPYYNEIERHRHDVLPGLTGLAQVNGRTAIGWDERFKYDIQYVKHISLIEDMKIIFLTVKKVFVRADIVEAGSQGNFDDYRKMQWKEKNEIRNW